MFDNIFLITTYQYPHLEHFYEDILFLKNNKKNVCVINIVPILYFRSDFCAKNFKRFFGTRILNSLLSNRVRSTLHKIRINSSNYIIPESKSNSLNLKQTIEEIADDLTIDFLRTFDGSFFSQINRHEILRKKIINSINSINEPIKKIVNDNSKSRFHIFSGRFPIERFLVDHVLNEKSVVFYECNNFNCGVIRKKIHTHKLNKYQEEIKQIKNKYSKKLLFKAVEELIKFRRKDKVISSKKYDFIFYSTSLDEIRSFSPMPNQLKLLFQFAESFKNNPNAAIRVHPNTRNKSIYDRQYWDFIEQYLKSLGVTILSYKEDIDSYSLSHENTLSFSGGSTITGELIFLNYKSFIIGNFMHFGEIIKNNSIDPSTILKSGFSCSYDFSKDFDKHDLVCSLLINYLHGEGFNNRYNTWMRKDAEIIYKILKIQNLDELLPIGLSQRDLLQ